MKLFTNMKNQTLARLAATTTLALLAVGCGQNRSGQYQGIEIGRGAGINSAPTSVRLTIQETGSDFINGTWSTQTSSGSFTGTLTADKVQNILLNKDNLANQNGSNTTSPITNPYGGSGFTSSTSYLNFDGSIVCLGRYTGSLNFDGNTISGVLTAAQGSYFQQNICTELEVRASKID